MRTVFLEAPEALLDERRRLGLDKHDELWDGVLHVVPPAGGEHQGFGTEFLLVVGPLAKRIGLAPRYDTGLFQSDHDYRVPDLLFCRPEHRSARGAEGAELVVEIRSPDDETFQKIDWYGVLGVREMLIVHPDGRRFELLRSVGGRLLPVTADSEGAVSSDVLGVRLATVGGRFIVTWAGGQAEI